jgi:hypothetical protein
MKIYNTPNGGTKINFDAGDSIYFKNIWGEHSHAYGSILEGFDPKSKSWNEKPCFLERHIQDGTTLIVVSIIPPNVHKLHDQWKYIVACDNKHFLLSEIYCHCDTRNTQT